MIIQPLSEKNIEKAIASANRSFPGEVDSDVSPEKAFWASLDKDKFEDFWQKRKLTGLKYFVGIDEETGEVIGVSGLYGKSEDSEAVWLAWFFVDPQYRGEGYGRELLGFAIDMARKDGYSLLRLYTSTDPEESAAQNLYEKVGLKIIDESRLPIEIAEEVKKLVPEYDVLFREKKL